MAKILLVEDDNNLREIYEARLQAEGYTIVSAQDGEDALVKAKQEHPDLVISDVMMPRISGFEMLDILRNTEGMKDMKVIMLTALGQAEDKTRADSLGADRYLVKSQVTLEDIVKAADELLNPAAPSTPQTAAAAAEVAASAATTTMPSSPKPNPATTTTTPEPKPAVTTTPTPTAPAPSIPVVAAPPVAPPTTAPTTPLPATTVPTETPSAPTPTAPVASVPVTPAPTPQAQAPSAPAAPAAAGVTTPTTPATPAAAPTPTSDKPVTTPTPDNSLANDKLIAEAVRDLTAAAEVANNPAKAADAQTVPPQPTPTAKPSVATEKPPEEKPVPVSNAATPSAPELPTAPQSETAPPAEATPPKQSPAASETPTTGHEEAAMQAQIENFIKQQGTGATATTETPAPTTTQNTAPAAEVTEDQLPQPPQTPEITKQGTPPSFSPPAAETEDDNENTDDTTSDSVAVAHKKIIEPPAEPVSPRPDLSELLAKEGISDIDGDDADAHANVVAPGGTTPHPPGHVITPTSTENAAPTNTAFNPDDPNNIAL